MKDSVFFTYLLSFFPYHTRIWNSLPKTVQSSNLFDFKLYTKSLKPTRHKHFNKGNKYSNSLLTRIRLGRSLLNQHRFTIGQVDTPECMCHHKEESSSHFFLQCFLFSQERRTLFDLFEHYIPNFRRFPNKKKLETILFGINLQQEEFYSTNIKLTIGVQNFILQTKRF